MRSMFHEISQIVNPVKFQKIQDDIALATGLALITVDYKGKPVTKHSNCSMFCQKVRSSKHGVYCEKCDSHGGLEAARLRKPFIYICHAGLIDFAIPILVNDLYLGAFMAGQILLSPSDHEYDSDILHAVLSTKSSLEMVFKEDYDLLPIMSLEKITALANMLLHIGNYCVKEAELKALLSYQSNKLGNKEEYFMAIASEEEPQIISTINQNYKKKANHIILPALTYIQKHPKEKITLDKMAGICNISPSYFSKLFSRENLGTLSDYVNQIKAEHAKKLLVTTDWTIRNISEHVGFEDCGYFIKVFKRITSQTPVEYRENKQS